MSGVFYTEDMRLTLNFTDVKARTLANIFKLDEITIYLVTDTNQVLLPSEETGKFDEIEFRHNSHYKIVGNPKPATPIRQPLTSSPYQTPTAAPSTSAAPQSAGSGLFSRDFRAAITRNIRRKISIVELDGRELLTTRTTFVSLGNGEYNVPSVASKVAESLDTPEVVVLLDNQNKEIMDCPATQEKGFWQMATRVVKAMTLEQYNAHVNHRYRKRKDNTRDLRELEDTFLEMAETARKIARVDKAAIILSVEPKHVKGIVEALSCSICQGPIKEPVASSCCKSILGCKLCLDTWWEESSQCPKCRSDDGREGRIDLKGLNNVFEILHPITGCMESNI